MSCPSCGNPKMSEKVLRSYNYRGSGLRNVRLSGGVTKRTCSKCRAAFVRIEREFQLLQVLALTLLSQERYLTGPEQRYLRRAGKLTQAELAEQLGVRRETIAERESKEQSSLSPGNEFLLRAVLLRAFRTALKEGDFLAAEHRRVLTALERRFVNFAERILRNRRQATHDLQVRQTQDTWDTELSGV